MIFNGDIKFHTLGAGTIQNAVMETFVSTGLPSPSIAGSAGRLIYVSDTKTYQYSDGTSWITFASGGNTGAIQSELDALEAALGTAINANGTINTAAFAGSTYLVGDTTFTQALLALDSAIHSETDALSALTDVTLTAPTTGQFLMKSAGNWVNHTLVLADVSDVTATAANVNILAGTLVTSTELGYVHGVTSDIQTQLNNKQPLDATLTALAGLTTAADQMIYSTGVDAFAMTSATLYGRSLLAAANAASAQITLALVPGTNVQAYDPTLAGLAALASTGIVVETSADVFTNRTLVAPVAGITITDPAGIAGNPTFALANNLAALEALSGPGFAVHLTATDTWALRSITGTAGNIAVANGNGDVSSPTIDLVAVTNAGGGSFLKLSTDSYGRVTGTSAVVAGDITALVDSTYVNVTGDSMSGTLTMTGGATVTGLPLPTAATDAASKAYVDAAASSLNVHGAVEAATTVDLGTPYGTGPSSIVYSNGTAGVGATLTNTGAGATLAAFAIDGYTTMVAGVTRVLIKNQASATQNGIYVVTTVGSGVAAWVLTRASDYDNSVAGQVHSGDFVWISEGNTLANTGFVETGIGTGTGDAIIIGTDNIVFTQFSGAGTYLAGEGLLLTGSTFSVKEGAGIASLPTGEVGIDLYNPSTGAIILTTNGTSRSTLTSAQLYLMLAAGSGLTQDATGLYISAAGVTNAMLANPAITLDGDTGVGSIALGGTMNVYGTAAQGIYTSLSGSTFTITAHDATTASKGVAEFSAASFTVTAGVVTISSAGVSNAQLANSSITFSDGTTPQAVSLGGTLSYVATAGTGIALNTTTADTVTIAGIDATTTSKGVAEFSSASFAVASGLVTIKSGGVANAQLVNSSITVAGNTGSDAVALGTTLTITGAGAISTAEAIGTVTISVADATTLVKGVASFNSAQFSVTSGAVSLNASLADLTNVSADPTLAGQILVYDTGVSKMVPSMVQYVYSSAVADGGAGPATSHTVTHSLGQKYCNVTVVDSLDEVIIPQGITFSSTSALSVTFNTAIDCKVIVMGVKGIALN